MGNMIGILIAIAIGVWVLFNLFRGAEEELRDEGRRTEKHGRSESLSSDVDRFLEEINRRRRDAMARETGAPSAEPPERRRPSPATQREAPQRRRQETIPTVVPVSRGRSAPPPVVELVVEPVVTPVDLTPLLPTSPSPSTTERTVSPAVTQLMKLLRNPQSLRTAFMLQEVLGPPRCRRRMP